MAGLGMWQLAGDFWFWTSCAGLATPPLDTGSGKPIVSSTSAPPVPPQPFILPVPPKAEEGHCGASLFLPIM